MKPKMITIVFVFSFLGLFAQSPLQNISTLAEDHKIEIQEDVSALKKCFIGLDDEYELDSIIYFEYPSAYDSILSQKTVYNHLENNDYTKITYEWDTLDNLWIPFEKTEYSFDENGNFIEYLRSNWDYGAGEWIPSRKYVLTYNAAGMEISFIYYKWDETNQEWGIWVQEEYEYNDENLMTAVWNWFSENLNGIWTEGYGNTLLYSETGKIVQSNYYQWDVLEEEWSNSTKHLNEYDTDDFLILKENYNWGIFSNDWELTDKKEYSNNSLGFPIEILDSYSQDNGMSWINSIKSELTYVDDFQLVLRLNYSWDDMTQDWVNSSKNEYGWDIYGNQILFKSFSWDSSLDDWLLYYMTERLYNEDGVVLMSATYSLDLIWQLLVGTSKVSFVLDENGNYSMVYHYAWDEALADWVVDEKGFYHYSLSTNIPEKLESAVRVFPNPATSVLAIQHPFQEELDFTIYTLQGKQVLQGKLKAMQSVIDLSGLQNGGYVLRVDNGMANVSKMFFKQ